MNRNENRVVAPERSRERRGVRFEKSVPLAFLGGLLALPLLVGCSEDLYFMMREEADYGGGWINHGGGCTLLKRKGATSVTGSPDADEAPDDDYFRVEYAMAKKEVTVTMTTKSDRIVRTYDKDFLRSGEVDVVEIVTDSGSIHRGSFWGGTECEAAWSLGGAGPE